MTNENNFILKIYRGLPKQQYWEEFELPQLPGFNVISALMEIQKNPINCEGKKVAPISWEDGCLEEVCGSCSMLIDGVPRQACAALIDKLLEKKRVITLAPLTKFPLIRDLVVDRSIIFAHFRRLSSWIEAGSSKEKAEPPLISPEKQEVMYQLASCMACGCCSEACPQVNNRSSFVGPAAISQARLFNAHPTGACHKENRLRPLMEEGGISDCGNAQNCVEVCPKHIPLTDSIATLSREVTRQAFTDLFNFKDRK